jgi:hypothetical protein
MYCVRQSGWRELCYEQWLNGIAMHCGMQFVTGTHCSQGWE